MSHIPSATDIEQLIPPCPNCQNPRTVKKGRRKNKLETIQLWQCKLCLKVFTPKITKHKTYPIKIIVKALSLYSKGYSLSNTSRLLKKDFGLSVGSSTISNWLADLQDFTPYRRLRQQGATLYSPKNVIKTRRLHHQQVYAYKIHFAKLDLLLRHKAQSHLSPIRDFLMEMFTNCPNDLFLNSQRASDCKSKYSLNEVEIIRLENLSNDLARFALQTVVNNHQRHEAVQDFMITNDSVTVAVEVPILLFSEDIDHLRNALGFDIPLEVTTVLTGHIDILQIRNGKLYILDYKPKAAKEKPIEQLMSYALAISRRTGIRLYDIVCAWFDDQDYFEFYPLHVVHKRK